MNDDAIREHLLAALSDVAPELEPDELEADEPLREELELDSMDFLNFVTGLSRRLGVEIAESEYGELETLDEAVAYLQEKLGLGS